MELFTHLASCKNRHLAPSFEKSSPEAVNRNCAMSGKAELLLISTPSGCGSSSSCRHGSVEHGNQFAHSSHQSCPLARLRSSMTEVFTGLFPLTVTVTGEASPGIWVSSDGYFALCMKSRGATLELHPVQEFWWHLSLDLPSKVSFCLRSTKAGMDPSPLVLL